VVGQYQRLINLTGNEAQTMRRQVKAAFGAAPSPNSDPATLPSSNTPSEPDLERLDSSLISQSAMFYESQGALIRDIKIMNQKLHMVNQLLKGRLYIIEFLVAFTDSFRNVGFGTGIRTASGLEIAGVTTFRDATLRTEVSRAEILRIRFEFECNLNSGVYFTFHGVKAVRNGEVIYLHRAIDALAFRVVDQDDRTTAGIVDLKFKPRIELSLATNTSAA
jgi:lipopolysaccharide transport system ATP-binding protein